MANRFWVGGTGNWSSTAHWSTSSGGATGASVPTSVDSVIFDNNSSGASYTVTLDTTANCLDMTIGNPATGSPTFTGVHANALNIYGSFTTVSGITWTVAGTVTFLATVTGKTVTSAGMTWQNDVNFSGVGGGWTLQDAFTVVSTNTLGVFAGTLNTNAKTITCGFLDASGSTVRTLTATNSTINCTGASTVGAGVCNLFGTNLTATMTGSTINVNNSTSTNVLGINVGTITIPNLIITAAGTVFLNPNGSPTFGNFSYTSTTNKTDQLKLGYNLNVTGILTLAGNSSVNRAFVSSDTIGTQRTITGGVVVASNLDLQDINIPGSNLAVQSEALSNVSWIKTNASTSGTTSGPGNTVLTKIVENATINQHYAQLSSIVNVSNGDTYTISAVVQAAERTQCFLEFVAVSGFQCVFDLAALTATGSGLFGGPAPTASGIINLGGGLYRVWMTGTFNVSNSNSGATLQLGLASGGVVSYSGDGSSGLYAGLVNLDKTSTLGTYKKTTTTTTTSIDLSTITGNSGDCLGNSGITFTPSAAQTMGSTGTINWSTATWTSRVPLPQDDVTVNTTITTALTVDMPRIGRNVNFTGFNQTLKWGVSNGSPSSVTVFGNWTLGTGMAVSRSGGLTFFLQGRGSQTITTNGVAINGGTVQFYGPGATWNQQDNISCFDTLLMQLVTYNTNNFTSTFLNWLIYPSATINMGSSTINLTATSGTPISVDSTATVNAGTSTINLTGTITGTATVNGTSTNKTFNNLNWSSTASTGTLIIAGTFTFNNFNVDCTTGRVLQLPASTTQTVSSITQTNTGINKVRNSSATGATNGVIGSGGVAPTNWSAASNCGLSVQIVGTGTANGLPYCDIRFFGTTTSGAGNTIRAESVTQIAAVNGQYWQAQFGIALVAGTLTNISGGSIAMDLDQVTNVGGFLSHIATTAITPTSTVQNVILNGLTSNASTAFIDPYFLITPTGTGVAVDATFRVVYPRAIPLLYLQSSSSGTAATISASSGRIPLDWTAIKDITVSGGAIWKQGPHSTSISNNTGWAGVYKYWVGGTGNWSDNTNHWSDSNGGAPGAVAPSSTTDVAFTEWSSGAAYTMTIDVTNQSCKDMHWFNPGVSGNPTIAGGSGISLNLFGSMTLVSGLSWTYTGQIWTGSTNLNETISTTNVAMSSTWNFASAGNYKLLDSFNINNVARTIQHTQGVFNTNGQTVTTGAYACTGAATRTFNATNSTINIIGTSGTVWNITGSALTLTMTGSTINYNGGAAGVVTSLTWGTQTYGTVNITAAGLVTMNNSPTFGNLSYTSTTNKTDQLLLAGNPTVTGILTLAGNSNVNRAFVCSSVLGTQRTITGGVVVASNLDLQDIAIANSGNLLQYSGNLAFSAAIWQPGNQTVGSTTAGPSGWGTLYKLIPNTVSSGHSTYQGPITGSAGTYSLSAVLSAAGYTWAGLSFGSGATNDGAFFDLTNGVLGTVAAGVTATITQIASGVYRCSISKSLGANSAYAQLEVHNANNQGAWVGDNTNGIYFGAVNLSLASSTSTYVATTSTALTALDLSAISGLSGDCLGNSGITFTSSTTQTFVQTAAGTYTWSTAANWTSRVPLPQDDVVINYSGANAVIINGDMPRIGRNINFTGYTKTAQFSTAFTLFGNWTLSPSMSFSGSTGTITYAGRGAQTITSAGNGYSQNATISAFGGSYTLQDTYTNKSTSIALTDGTFNDNGFTTNLQSFNISGTRSRTRNISGTLNLSGTSSTCWSANATGDTVNVTGTINITGTVTTSITFAGGGFTYGNVNWSSTTATGTLIITGANTFANFNVDCTTPRVVQFPNGVTQTFGPAGITQTNATLSNKIRNPSMTGAAIGTVGSGGALPTNWLQGGTASGLSLAVQGTGTENGFPYIDLRWFGTASATQTYGVYFEGITQIPSLIGQAWRSAAMFKLSAGAMTGTDYFQIGSFERNAGGSSLVNHTSNFTPTSTPVVQKVDGVNTNASTAFQTAGVFLAFNNGDVIDVTLRIYNPQLYGLLAVNSDSSGLAATLSQASGRNALDYLYYKDITVTGGAIWKQGSHSTSVSNNTGWAGSYKYWVGGTGNWSDNTNHWSDTNGGAPGAVAPSSTTDVAFTEWSSGTAYTATVDVNPVFKDMHWFNPGVSGNPTIAGTNSFVSSCSGSVTLVSGMIWSYTGTMTFVSSNANETITTAGVALGNGFDFNGTGTWTLQDNVIMNASHSLQLDKGTLKLNGKTVTTGFLISTSSTTRTLDMTNSTINLIGVVNTIQLLNVSATSLTLISTGSTINIIGGAIGVAFTLTPSNLSYGAVNITGPGSWILSNTPTFNSFSYTSTTNKTDSLFLSGGIVTISAGGSLTLAGNSVTNRAFVLSGTIGTQRTISVPSGASVSISNADFQDIAFGGTFGTVSGTSLGDCLGNSGITFDASVAQTYSGGASTWSDATKWTTRVPLPQDDVTLGASVSGAITFDMPRLGRNINAQNLATNWVSTASGVTTLSFFGSLTLGSVRSYSSTATWQALGRGNLVITSNGASTLNGLSLSINSFGGTYTFTDAWASNSAWALVSGTVTANGNMTTFSGGFSFANASTLNPGTGTWTVGGVSSSRWSMASTVTVNGTPNVNLTGTVTTTLTFIGGGKTYGNVTWSSTASTGTLIITGNNTFNNFTVDCSTARTVQFPAGGTQTVANFIQTNRTTHVVSLVSSTPGTQWTISCPSGVIICDYLSISDSIATGGATWLAGGNSVNN